MAVTMQIGSLTFDIMFEEFGETYTNALDRIQSRKSSVPLHERWGKGQIDNISIEIEIVAGVSPDVQSGADVVRTCQTLMGYAVHGSADAGGGTRLNEQTLKIGNWYTRVVLVQSARVAFKAPWDESAQPMRAVVALDMMPVGLKNKVNKNSYSFAGG